jgi:GH25 family lysozyme M1 (1,4-beta-N-acetylmuramidase)
MRICTALVAVALAAAGYVWFAWPASAAAQVEGLDVSSHQNERGTISWSQVRGAGQSFVYIKATEGVSYTNPYYAANNSGARTAGLLRGAYHFARPDSSAGDAVAEARYFVSVTGTSLAGQLPPTLDIEASGGLSASALVAWAKAFLAEVERLTGRVPVIYTGPAFWRSSMGDSREFHRHPLWIAQYTTGAPSIPGGWPAYTFWQNTSSFRVAGITGNVDHNFFPGTMAQLQALAAGTANPHTPTEVCGAGYEVIDQAALGSAGTVYLLYNATKADNCVATIKATSIGTASPTSAYLEVQGKARVTDSGSFAYYAGPVRASAPSTCVKWGGSVGTATYDSPFEHCD